MHFVAGAVSPARDWSSVVSTQRQVSVTFGGGGAGLSCNRFFMTKTPRITGEERSPLDPAVRKAVWVSSPPRGESAGSLEF